MPCVYARQIALVLPVTKNANPLPNYLFVCYLGAFGPTPGAAEVLQIRYKYATQGADRMNARDTLMVVYYVLLSGVLVFALGYLAGWRHTKGRR